MSRDRVEKQLVMDNYVKEVVNFMQDHIPASRLVSVAEWLPDIAKLLWSHNPQEPIRALSLEVICLGRAGGLLQDATESAVAENAGDDSVGVEACR